MLVPAKLRYPVLLIFLAGHLGTSSCTYKELVAFPFYGTEDKTPLYGLSQVATSGALPLSKPEVFEYVFEKTLPVPPQGALEVAYRIRPVDGTNAGTPPYRITFIIEGEAAWVLPYDASFLGMDTKPSRIRYVIPVNTGLEKIRLQVASESGDNTDSPVSDEIPAWIFELHSLSLVNRWYGFTQEFTQETETPRNFTLRASPFVFQEEQEPRYPYGFSINPPSQYQITGGLAVYAEGEASTIRVSGGNRRFDYTSQHEGSGASLFIPSGALPPVPYPLKSSGNRQFKTFMLIPAQNPSFPEHPIIADPGIILNYPQQNWRDPRYECFQWKDFPSILIFDTADYKIQDALFKRLAFFTEKAGFRGRLAADQEIANLHGWNAHDYRAKDLAAFFEAAQNTGFPLSQEERELESILQAAGIINRTETGAWSMGTGAVISLSRESPEYLRSQFMVHEGFHGLFFIDEDFRNFSRHRFETLNPTAKEFILSFFDYQHYDVQDSYLMLNEFMAHVLQQPVSHAASYFGEYLAARINASPWRRTVLPPMDEASHTWPDIARAFHTEAGAFSAYVNQRWGFAAGKVNRITVR
ncbi:MAG: hypothetical protein LBB80_08810 [Treponema sp.]|jgi:hypothetical protein|nr:hypothetical protein [Treponema sp.]